MKYIGIILLTVFATCASYAQPPKGEGPPKGPSAEEIETMVSNLSEQLELTSDQQKNVSAMFNAHFEEIKSTKNKNREAMEVLRNEFIEQITAEIGEDKKKEFQEFMKSQKPERKKREK
ncbi:MAG: hypothetical protein ABJH98_12830 [Reichenbachiella sp.]|uniref:hypothetical protein n=1 Tax=Reichenbachiella sp. TaxID=2184521 RepID=UPI0032997304